MEFGIVSIVGRLVLAAMAASSAAMPVWAQLVPMGREADVTVEYEYVSKGKRQDAYDLQEWQVRRFAVVSATVQAQKPTEFPALHKVEQAQQNDIAGRQAAIGRAATAMQPTMNDMMAIAEKCNDDEACIEKAVTDYATRNRGALLETKKKAAPDAAIASRQGPLRYQAWIPVGVQSGRFEVSERVQTVDADPICRGHANQRCRSERTRNGSGPIPLPPGAQPGGKQSVGSAALEVDSGTKKMVLTLPVPLMPLTVKQVFRTDHPSSPEKSGDSSHTFRFPSGDSLKSATTMTVALTGNGPEHSGTRTIKVQGSQNNPRVLESSAPEDGILTVRWNVKLR